MSQDSNFKPMTVDLGFVRQQYRRILQNPKDEQDFLDCLENYVAMEVQAALQLVYPEMAKTHFKVWKEAQERAYYNLRKVGEQ